MDKKTYYDIVNGKLAQKFETEAWMIDYVRHAEHRLHLSRKELIDRQHKIIKLHNRDLDRIKRKQKVNPDVINSYPEHKQLLLDRFSSRELQKPFIYEARKRRYEILDFLKKLSDDAYEYINQSFKYIDENSVPILP